MTTMMNMPLGIERSLGEIASRMLDTTDSYSELPGFLSFLQVRIAGLSSAR